jgi:hypothetical protein
MRTIRLQHGITSNWRVDWTSICTHRPQARRWRDRLATLVAHANAG